MSRRPWLMALTTVLLVPWTGCPDEGDDDTTDSSYTEAQVADVGWTLHEEIGSLIYVSWDQLADADAHVEYSFDEGEWLQTPPRRVDAGPCEQLLLGVPYATDVTLRVVNDFGAGPLAAADVQAQTGALPEGIPLPELVVSDATAWEPGGQYLIGSINQYDGGWSAASGNFFKFVIDRQGRYVWAWLTPDRNWTLFMQISSDGTDLLWDEFTYWSAWDEGAGSQVHRSKLDGSTETTHSTPGGHHAFVELPDRSVVWGAADWSGESLLKLDPQGIQHELWNCGEFLDTHSGANYCQSNTITWHAPTDSFIYSFYSIETVVQVDHATGATLDHWGHLEGSWAFDPPESAFYWQHGANITEAGTLLTSSYAGSWEAELVAREYELDHDAEVLREIWSFGEGEGIIGDTAGEAHRLANGNTLHNFGSGCRVREITPDGVVVWDVDWPGTKLLGRTAFVEDLYALAP